MTRPSSLSPDNILRFLQVTRDAASANEVAAALHVGKADRKALNKMLAKMKKRGAIAELPGGRYRLAGRRSEGESGSEAARSTGDGARREKPVGSSSSGVGSTGNIRRSGE